MKTTQKQFDNFTNFRFSHSEWSAPMLKSADEIKKELDSMKLIGRCIKNMKMIGLSYYLTRDWIESEAYNQLSHLPEAERQERSDYNNISPDMGFSRYSEIDEPFLIEFDDGDVFEIDAPHDIYFRFSMNRIPWYINAGINLPNTDANKLFSVCIGKKITDVEVHTYKNNNSHIYSEPSNNTDEENEFVLKIILRLENGIGLCVRPVFGFCCISCIDKNNEEVLIPFKELKDALFNYQDLHTDEAVNFEGSTTLYFGEKSSEHVEDPYMSLVPSGKDTALYISVDDFHLFAWSMTIVLKEDFDEYGNYNITYEKWNEILCEGRKIIDFKTFDDLFDYIVAQFNNGLRYMNNHGAEFWKNKAKYKTQLSDVTKWSELVLGKNDVLNIYGF